MSWRQKPETNSRRPDCTTGSPAETTKVKVKAQGHTAERVIDVYLTSKPSATLVKSRYA